jgi:DNA recombination protein RmuC
MIEYLAYAVVGLVFLVFGFILGKYRSQLLAGKKHNALHEENTLLKHQNDSNRKTVSELQHEIKALSASKQALDIALAKYEVEKKNLNHKLEEQQAETLKLQEKLTKDFEILANKILEEKSNKFTAQNKENLKTILDPLKEKINLFEKKVEDTNKDSIGRHADLRRQILNLAELNEQMSKEAVNLTKALKGDSKIQGDWGETQLEVLLEKANLVKGIHYSTQGGFKDDKGILKKPDFIINLPENKHLIIDAKVSLTAYEAYFNCESEDEKQLLIKKHLLSVKNHIKELGEKRYAELYSINSPDYVLMFMPIEPALMLALQEDSNLYLGALDKNVVLVSSSTLLATLSTVSSIWNQEDQKKNVLEIARRAGALYDKFEGFVQDLLRIGKSISTSKESYDKAMNKLVEGHGNLITSVEKIKKLGVKTKKSLPQNILDRAEE